MVHKYIIQYGLYIYDICLNIKYNIKYNIIDIFRNKSNKINKNNEYKILDINYFQNNKSKPVCLKSYKMPYEWTNIEKYIGKYNKDSYIHIKYTINNNIYRINYLYGNAIIFPPYKNNIKIKTSISNKKILFATNNGHDITNILYEYAGPLQDFHIGIVNYIDILAITNTLKYNNYYSYGSYNLNYVNKINITNNDLDEYELTNYIILNDNITKNISIENETDNVINIINNTCEVEKYVKQNDLLKNKYFIKIYFKIYKIYSILNIKLFLCKINTYFVNIYILFNELFNELYNVFLIFFALYIFNAINQSTQ
jgi:hypothetical protein